MFAGRHPLFSRVKRVVDTSESGEKGVHSLTAVAIAGHRGRPLRPSFFVLGRLGSLHSEEILLLRLWLLI